VTIHTGSITAPPSCKPPKKWAQIGVGAAYVSNYSTAGATTAATLNDVTGSLPVGWTNIGSAAALTISKSGTILVFASLATPNGDHLDVQIFRTPGNVTIASWTPPADHKLHVTVGTDSGLSPGTYTYQLQVYDPSGAHTFSYAFTLITVSAAG